MNLPDNALQWNRRKILVADDEEAVRNLLATIIRENLGCPVDTALSGDEAIHLLDGETYHIFITDMSMPGLHGLDLVKKVGASWPDVDMIVMTGYPSAFPYVEIINAGAKDFIIKPHTSQELVAKLVRMFKEHDLLEAKQAAEERYRCLFNFSMDGNVLLDPESFAILDTNHAFSRICGLPMKELKGKIVLDLLPKNERERFQTAVKLCLRGGQGTVGDVTLVNEEGDLLFLDAGVTYIDVSGESILLVAFKDVTEKRYLEQRLTEAVEMDITTNLFNKRAFVVRLEGAIQREALDRKGLVLLIIDIDNFKAVNDSHGHQTGDQLLHSVGHMINKSIRGNDIGFRYGGDEFAVLLSGVKSDAATAIAERMRRYFEKLETYKTSLSIGVAEFRGGMSATEFVKAADEALYQAKAEGKDTVCLAKSAAV